MHFDNSQESKIIEKQIKEQNKYKNKNLKTIQKSKSNTKKTNQVKNKETNLNFSQKNGGGARTSIGVNLGYANMENNGNFMFDVDTTLAISPSFYIGASFGNNPDYNDKKVFLAFITCGLNFRIPLGSYYPNFYLDAGVGLSNLERTSETVNGNLTTTETDLFTLAFRCATGIDFPLGEKLALNFQYSLTFFEGLEKFTNKYSLGFRITELNKIKF